MPVAGESMARHCGLGESSWPEGFDRVDVELSKGGHCVNTDIKFPLSGQSLIEARCLLSRVDSITHVSTNSSTDLADFHLCSNKCLIS